MPWFAAPLKHEVLDFQKWKCRPARYRWHGADRAVALPWFGLEKVWSVFRQKAADSATRMHL